MLKKPIRRRAKMVGMVAPPDGPLVRRLRCGRATGGLMSDRIAAAAPSPGRLLAAAPEPGQAARA
ncbi:MAG: hypothetical protein RSH52_21165, partial [Janthinobacterium sp.]